MYGIKKTAEDAFKRQETKDVKLKPMQEFGGIEWALVPNFDIQSAKLADEIKQLSNRLKSKLRTDFSGLDITKSLVQPKTSRKKAAATGDSSGGKSTPAKKLKLTKKRTPKSKTKKKLFKVRSKLACVDLYSTDGSAAARIKQATLWLCRLDQWPIVGRHCLSQRLFVIIND